jgi:hypothetical protein
MRRSSRAIMCPSSLVRRARSVIGSLRCIVMCSSSSIGDIFSDVFDGFCSWSSQRHIRDGLCALHSGLGCVVAGVVC